MFWSSLLENMSCNMSNINNETATRLLIEGATFVLLNVPEGTEFGIDMKSWNTAENFRGIKMIPPGLHFIHYSSVNNVGDTAPRKGFIYNFRKSEFVVKRWDRKTEDLMKEGISDSEIVKLRENLLTLDKFLGPYPYDVYVKWCALTNHWTDELVGKLSPVSGVICSALDLVSCNSKYSKKTSENLKDKPSCSSTEDETQTKRRRLRDKESLLPELKPIPGTELRLAKFPELNYPEDATPTEITQHSLDSSYVLDQIISQHKSITDLIGEIQFSYICFLVGHSLEAFEHWKELVGLICSCEKAIVKHRHLYDLLISVLNDQLKEIPEDFLADIVSNNNYIYCKLRNLFRSVEESSVDGRLKSKMWRFRDSLTEKYLWDFNNLNEEEDDEAPVIVEA